MEITAEELLKRGFKDTSYEDEGNHFQEFDLDLKDRYKLNVYGDLSNIEIVTPSFDWMETNAKTLEDLDQLIKLLK